LFQDPAFEAVTTSGVVRAGVVLCAVLLAGAGTAQAQQPAAANPEFEFTPTGYVQLDWRGYPDWDVPTGSGRLNRDTFEVRRARLGVDGRWRRLSYEVSIDPQDDTDGVAVKDAYGQFRFGRAMRLRIGQFKLPGSREYGTSARTMDFMERAAFADVAAAGRDLGGMVLGDIGRLGYEAGVFVGDGNGRVSRAETTGAGRVQFAVSPDLELGGSFSTGRTNAVDDEAPNGIVGRAASGYRFFDQVYVNGGRMRAGGDVAWEQGPWRVAGEFMRTTDQRGEQGLDFEDLPDVVSNGWMLSLTRTLGEREGPARVRWHEVALAVRLDYLGFDDDGPDGGSDSVRPRATNIRPRSVLATSAGASWRPLRWTRVLTTVSWERYDEARSAPEPGTSGYLTLGMRLQLMLQ
jgi:hypothetical protein